MYLLVTFVLFGSSNMVSTTDVKVEVMGKLECTEKARRDNKSKYLKSVCIKMDEQN